MGKGKRFDLDSLKGVLSDAFKARNPELFGNVASADAVASVPARPSHAKAEAIGHGKNTCRFQKRIDTLNKTEMRYYDTYLAERDGRDCTVLVQPPRLFELEGGGTYTPDFLVIEEGGVTSVEIKGGYKGPGAEQGIERYKRAASQWADERISFVMATWMRKEMRWRIEPWRK